MSHALIEDKEIIAIIEDWLPVNLVSLIVALSKKLCDEIPEIRMRWEFVCEYESIVPKDTTIFEQTSRIATLLHYVRFNSPSANVLAFEKFSAFLLRCLKHFRLENVVRMKELMETGPNIEKVPAIVLFFIKVPCFIEA